MPSKRTSGFRRDTGSGRRSGNRRRYLDVAEPPLLLHAAFPRFQQFEDGEKDDDDLDPRLTPLHDGPERKLAPFTQAAAKVFDALGERQRLPPDEGPGLLNRHSLHRFFHQVAEHLDRYPIQPRARYKRRRRCCAHKEAETRKGLNANWPNLNQYILFTDYHTLMIQSRINLLKLTPTGEKMISSSQPPKGT